MLTGVAGSRSLVRPYGQDALGIRSDLSRCLRAVSPVGTCQVPSIARLLGGRRGNRAGVVRSAMGGGAGAPPRSGDANSARVAVSDEHAIGPGCAPKRKTRRAVAHGRSASAV